MLHLRVEGQGQPLPYVELLQQWLTATCRMCLGSDRHAILLAALVTDAGLRYPLLMHSALALAALHLSRTNEDRAQEYLSQAKDLQAEGLAAFQRLQPNDNSDHFVPAFLFSFITGVHNLAHALSEDTGTSESFLASVIACIDLLRGVPIVLGGNMARLQSSVLGPLMFAQQDSQQTLTYPSAVEMIDKLQSNISEDKHSDAEFAALHDSIDRLKGLYAGEYDNQDESLGTAVVWMMTAQADLTQMLAERDPAALAVFAHIAPLLHAKRKCWAVQNSPGRLLNAIEQHVPREQHHWLEWPRKVVQPYLFK